MGGGGKRAGGDMSHPVYILKEALFYDKFLKFSPLAPNMTGPRSQRSPS